MRTWEGTPESSDFPTTPGAFNSKAPDHSRGESATFVAKLNSTGTALIWATYLGSSPETESVSGLAADSSGNVYVAGTTTSPHFPMTPGAIFPSNPCCYSHIFISELSADGSTLKYAAEMDSQIIAMAFSANGALYITGAPGYEGYPATPGAYETTVPAPTNNTGYVPQPAFVTKIDMTSPTACTVSLSPDSARVPSYGGSGSFEVTIPDGCPWHAVPDRDTTLGPITHGVSSATVSYTVAVTDNVSSPRTLPILVGPKTFTITQDKGSCSELLLTPSSLHFTSAGGVAKVSVAMPCSILAAVSNPWLQAAASATVLGSGTVTVSAAPNSFGPRSGTVTVNLKTLQVTQDGSGCSASVVAPTASLPLSGGTGNFHVMTTGPSCSWAVYGAPPWMQINAASLTGQGNANLGFVVAANITPVSRSATLEIAGQAVTVRQDAGPFGNRPDSYIKSRIDGEVTLADGVPATFAQFDGPSFVAWQNGDLYIAELNSYHGLIRVVTPDGLIHTVAGGGSAASGPARGVDLGYLTGMTIASDGTLYTISLDRLLSIANDTVTVVAESDVGQVGDFGPQGVAVDPAGNIFVSSGFLLHEISGGVFKTIGGNGHCNLLDDNIPVGMASFCYPRGLADNGSLFVADSLSHRVRVIDPNGIVKTVAGGGTASAPPTGVYVPATSVALKSPYEIAVDPIGNLYSTDGEDIWRVISWDNGTLSEPLITKITGGTSGIDFNYENGATLDVAADDAGNIYVASPNLGVFKLTPSYSFCSVGAQNGLLVLTPADGSPGIVTSPILTWTSVSGATSYDVYFGTSSPPPLAGNVTCAKYNPPPLADGTVYYWKIVPKGSSGLMPSAVQSFTTQSLKAPNPLSVASAADGFNAVIAPNSIATAYGNNLANATQSVDTLPLPTSVKGTTLALLDSTGKLELAPIFFVSGGAPDQVNFLVPSDIALGPATVVVTAQDGTVAQGATNVSLVSPGLFQLNASGLAAALVFDATTNTVSNVFEVSSGQIVPRPIGVPASDKVFLELFGTGLRSAGQSNVSVKIGTTDVEVSYAGAQGSFQGLDQVNVALPSSLSGSGDLVVQLTAAGMAANPVRLTIK